MLPRALLQDYAFDLLVVDVMMPRETGIEFVRTLRLADTAASELPVLMLTAMGEQADRIKGFEAGADDYLPKPFEPMELLLRVRAILRRRPPPRRALTAAITIGPWTLPPEQNILQNATETVRLTDIEAKFLRILAQNPASRSAAKALTHKWVWRARPVRSTCWSHASAASWSRTPLIRVICKPCAARDIY